MENNSSLLKCRRDCLRYRVDSSATMVVDKNKEKPLLVHDICARGAGLISNYPLPLMGKIIIDLLLPFSHIKIQREAKVVWCKQIDDSLWQGGVDFGMTNKIQL